jgi:hypothetical protein
VIRVFPRCTSSGWQEKEQHKKRAKINPAMVSKTITLVGDCFAGLDCLQFQIAFVRVFMEDSMSLPNQNKVITLM